jgi:hypothetical protein
MTKVGAILGAVLVVLLCAHPVRADGLQLPSGAVHGLDLLYSGQGGQAIAEFKQIQAAEPDSPLGYLLEAEADWWEIYCESCSIRWNTIDAWHRSRQPSDEAYLALLDKGIHLAEMHIAKSDSAEMEFYAGMGWGLRARLMGLFDDHRGVARAGVNGRARLLRCLELDPQMADAYAGLGLYNYYVDTLSGLAKVLRFFMGIPGGDKREGVRQLRVAMEHGVLTRAGARFYLANNLRVYDHDYFASIDVLSPLVAQYPQNPVFQLVLGDNHAKLAHWELAAAILHAAAQLPISNGACAAHVRAITELAIAAFPHGQIHASN